MNQLELNLEPTPYFKDASNGYPTIRLSQLCIRFHSSIWHTDYVDKQSRTVDLEELELEPPIKNALIDAILAHIKP